MSDPTARHLDLESAATVLGLPTAAVSALAESGYLRSVGRGSSGPEFQLSDVKAFLARNADDGAGSRLLDLAMAESREASSDKELAPQELVHLLDERAEHMAWRMFKIYSTVFPEVGRWPLDKQGEFVAQTKGRLEALLAVSERGARGDDTLFEELQEIGASAARTGASLSHLLVPLRMSRDLVVQNAVELAESDGRHSAFALSLLLTRILPTMDRLSDALANGYWQASGD